MTYSVTKCFTVAPVLISISALKRIGREEGGMVGRFLAIPTGCRFQVCPAGTTTYWSRGLSKGPRPPPGARGWKGWPPRRGRAVQHTTFRVLNLAPLHCQSKLELASPLVAALFCRISIKCSNSLDN